jgi:hypothetical protein
MRHVLYVVSLFLISLSWFAVLPFTEPDRWLGLIYFALGTVLFFLCHRREDVPSSAPAAVLSVPALAFTVWILPFPYDIGACFMLVGVLAFLLRDRILGGNILGQTGKVLGSILLVQAFALALCIHVFSRYHEAEPLAVPLYLLARIIDPSIAYSDGRVLFPSEEEVFRVPVTWEGFGAPFMILFFLALLGTGLRHQRKLETVVKLVGLFVGYALLRNTILAFLLQRFKDPYLYCYYSTMFWSFLPLAVLSAYLLRPREGEHPTLPQPFWRVVLPTGLLFAAAGFLLIGSYAFHDPGTRKGGRVMIDEYHSQWEWTTRALDKEWYGRDSGYNYYCLGTYLDVFYEVDIRQTPFDRGDLSDYDVLIIKTPTKMYTADELDAIEDFVREGGGLFLIGDHTNVFGTSTYLNPIASMFGLQFRHDSQYDLDTGGLTLIDKPRVLAHPVLADLPYFLFATSCTLEPGLLSENVIIGSGMRALEVDYSQTSYFPEKRRNAFPYGYFIQQAGKKYGRGRVLAFTDSTTFSNFFMFVTGKPELLIGSVEWLNRENRLRLLNVVLFFAGVVVAVIVSWIVRRAKFNEPAFALAYVAFGICLGIAAFDSFTNNAYAPPTPKREYVSVCFEDEHSNIDLPTRNLVPRSPEAYHTFFTWTQRLGYVPSLNHRIEDCFTKADMLVIVNPVKRFTIEEVDSTYAFVANGGSLLLIDSAHNKNSSVRDLAGAFGIEVYLQEPDSSSITDAIGNEIVPALYAGYLEGGVPVLYTERGRPVLCEKQVGNGTVVVFVDSYMFSDEIMGGTGVTPDETQRKIYDLEFWILEELLNPTRQGTAR